MWNDWDHDGILSDDERDFDNDGLANIYEYWPADFEPWDPAFPGTLRPDFLDPDTDGDGVLDGADDQDHDDVSNIDELRNGTWTMNPCDPVVSRTCPRWLDGPGVPRSRSTSASRRRSCSTRRTSEVDRGRATSRATDAGLCPTYP